MNQQYFVCRTCPPGHKYLIHEMKQEVHIHRSGKRGLCLPCHSDYEKQQRFRRLAEAKPDDFLTCDDCDKIFSKFVAGRTPKNGKKKLRTCCPYCTSENISRY